MRCGWQTESIWTYPTCGDGICDEPLEFEAFGNLGCQVDCGKAYPLYDVLLVLQGNFRESPLGTCTSETVT